jgi:ADP-ribose pyrophosphatase YjhB (NUDIX family)
MPWHPHTTVATLVEKDGTFLMVEEDDDGRTVFNQPAGHLDEDESLFDAAVRETLEETAWYVTLTNFLGTYVYKGANNGVTYVRHCFIANADQHDPQRSLDDGIIAAHWLSADEIFADSFPARSPLVTKTLEDYLSGRRLPLDTLYHLL